MVGYDAGFQEPEFNRAEGRAWRWISEKAALWVRPVGRAVTLRLIGESPARQLGGVPHVRVLIADREVAAFDPEGEFDQAVTLPAELLDRASGHVVLESSRFFVPAATGAADQRHLALRIFRTGVE